jgi:hypothetical protein
MNFGFYERQEIGHLKEGWLLKGLVLQEVRSSYDYGHVSHDTV